MKRFSVFLMLVALLIAQHAAKAETASEAAARSWAQAYGLDPDYFWRVALCESSGDPGAVGPASADGTPYGLYQFKPATFLALRAALNADTTLAPHLSTYDPEYRGLDEDAVGDAEAHVAAWAFAHGYSGLWECA